MTVRGYFLKYKISNEPKNCGQYNGKKETADKVL